MKGDFTRGYRPDSKDGRTYRRVLMQQGRLLLDSDVNALVDALDTTTRGIAADLGCPSGGSPDLGYLMTPGPLLALFESLDHVEASSGVTIRRDYGRKYLGRFPSLLIGGPGSDAGAVTITFRQEHTGGKVVVWMQTDSPPVQVKINNANTTIGTTEFSAVERDIASETGAVEVEVPAQTEIRIGMIEARLDAETEPKAFAAAGRFHLDGVAVTNRADLLWSDAGLHQDEVTLSANVPDLSSGSLLLAYLEVWEQHRGDVEDPAIRETALGGIDTCTRTRSLGQVRMMKLSESDPDIIRKCFSAPRDPDSKLTVTTPGASESDDPCALPQAGGYTGVDNRLYRFEVHEKLADDPGQVIVKWSRNNGSDLVEVKGVSSSDPYTVQLRKDAPVTSGAVVELLSEPLELSEQGEAKIQNDRLIPADSMVGQLARIAGPGDDGVTWTLHPFVSPGSTPPDDEEDPHFQKDGTKFPANAPEPTKLRVWHGTLSVPIDEAERLPYDVEDGIKAELSGELKPREYWEWAARAGSATSPLLENAPPHGPERRFAPLALFRFLAAGEPLELVAWLDRRFSPLCGLSADDIAFDSGACEAEAATVQEMLEALCQREAGGCCEETLEPSGDDDAEAIQGLIDDNEKHPNGVVICLKPGIYRLESPIAVTGKRVKLLGCPDAVLSDARSGSREEPLIAVTNVAEAKGRLELASLTLLSPAAKMIDLDPQCDGLEAREVGFVSTLKGQSTPGLLREIKRVIGVIEEKYDIKIEPNTQNKYLKTLVEIARIRGFKTAFDAASQVFLRVLVKKHRVTITLEEYKKLFKETEPTTGGVIISVGDVSPVVPKVRRLSDDDPLPGYREKGTVSVQLEECVVAGGWLLAGTSLQRLSIRDTYTNCLTGGCYAGGIDELEICHWTYLSTDLGDLLENITADELHKRGAAALDFLPAESSGEGAALVVGRVDGGLIQSSHISAGWGVYGQGLRGVQFQGNTYRTEIAAIWLIEADRTSVHDEDIEGSEIGVTIRFSARDVTISSCRMTSVDEGILLPFENTEEAFSKGVVPSGETILIQENIIQARRRAIHIGFDFIDEITKFHKKSALEDPISSSLVMPEHSASADATSEGFLESFDANFEDLFSPSGDFILGQMSSIDISANQIETPGMGITFFGPFMYQKVTIPLPRPGPGNLGDATLDYHDMIRIGENRIVGASIGIFVIDCPRLEIADNLLSLSPEGTGTGVVAALADTVIIEDNVIRQQTKEEERELPFDRVRVRTARSQPSPFNVGWELFSVIAGPDKAMEQAGAIICLGISDPLVKGNVVRDLQPGAAGLFAYGLFDAELDRSALKVTDNDFGTSPVDIRQFRSVQCRENLAGLIGVIECGGGAVTNNVVAGKGLAGSIYVHLNSESRWQVIGNQAQRGIRLIPETDQRSLAFVSTSATETSDASPQPKKKRGKSPEESALMNAAKFRMKNQPSMKFGIQTGIYSDPAVLVLEDAYLAYLFKDIVFWYNNFGQERKYSAQVESNKASIIQVGYTQPVYNVYYINMPDSFAGTMAWKHPETVVQVVGNWADKYLGINNYSTGVVAHNYAPSIAIGVTKTDTFLNRDNVPEKQP